VPDQVLADRLRQERLLVVLGRLVAVDVGQAHPIRTALIFWYLYSTELFER
jgi:hypothetical protein